MTFEEFKDEVKEKIRDYLPEEYRTGMADIRTVNKNNEAALSALYILGEKQRIAPVVYLENFFRMYQEGETMDEVLSRMADEYVEALKEGLDVEIGDFNYEDIKSSLTVAVCNAGKNRKALQDVPHERREDLALFYCVRIPISEYAGGMITIHNSHLEFWGIGGAQLKKDAWESMKKETPALFQSVEDVIAEAGNAISFDVEIQEGQAPFVESDFLFVLSNRSRVQGAAYMFDEDTMEKIAEKLNSNLVVLPSSIHETVILRETKGVDMDCMRDMVKEVNELYVRPMDWLSDEVYRYDRENHTLSMIKSAQPEEDILPDKVSVEEMHDYGYTWDGMLPLTKAKALELMDCGLEVYRLTADNAEGMLLKKDEIYAHDGLFGVEKEAWKSHLESQNLVQAEGMSLGMVNA